MEDKMVSRLAPRKDHELPLIINRALDARDLRNGDPNDERRSRLCIWLSGWKFSLFLASVACIIVLAFNLGFLLWAVARDNVGDGQGVLYQGNCGYVRRMSTGLHLLINILSTVLLGASNYGMQCLCASTRNEIDKVHREGNWLDIGVPSLRNLVHVSGKRLFLWICLSVSSLPLHLVYNTTIFSTTSAYAYGVFAGAESLGRVPAQELSLNMTRGSTSAFHRLHEQARNGSLERLSALDCINAYATIYQTRHGSLLLATENTPPNQYDLVFEQQVFNPYDIIAANPPSGDPYEWLCPRNPSAACSNYISRIRRDAEERNWIVYSERGGTYRVDSCLAERIQENCKLEYSLPLTVTVIVANAVKASVLCYMALRMRESPILTMGDAVASFLHRPDRHSLGKCLVPGKEIKDRYSTQQSACLQHMPMVFEGKRKRWYSTVSRRQWIAVLSCWLLAILICAFLLVWGTFHDGPEVWSAEFGSIDPKAVIKSDTWPSSLTANTLIANTPQLLFSLLYFAFNALLTGMAIAAEWSRYATSRRGLRVSSNPRVAQRSSYFLSLPYRYAIPLMGCSAILHWLISQSLFLVRIQAFDEEREPWPGRDLLSCGYTPVAIVCAITVGVFRFCCIAALGVKRLGSGMVVAGSCSFAIAAACHPRYDPNSGSEMRDTERLRELGWRIVDGESMVFLPVQWGVVPQVPGELGHCSFSSEEVQAPRVGHVYQ
ncbi:hypothetical protein BJX66DRAFT_116816 [Aspergillus keveii]|uniref:DUF6536 domain-containing protein n=1 Tax=Aspergillus keveii TaxID=714993 RepID=A0ABR4FKA7_9EURO